MIITIAMVAIRPWFTQVIFTLEDFEKRKNTYNLQNEIFFLTNVFYIMG